MKKMFFVVLALIVSATTYTKAQSLYSAFLKNAYVNHLNDASQYRDALKEMAKGDTVKWYPTAKSVYVSGLSITFPGESLEAIIAGTIFESAPNDMNISMSVGRLSKATGEESQWERNPYAGELIGYYRGIPWTSTACGNRLVSKRRSSSAGSSENDNAYRLALVPTTVPVAGTNTASNTNTVTGGTAGQPIIIINNIPAPPTPAPAAPTQPLLVYAPPAPQQYAPAPQQYAPAPQQYAPAPQYAYQGPQEVVISQRRDFLDYLDVGSKVFNSAMFGINTFRGVRFEDRGQSQNQVVNTTTNRRYYNDGWSGNDDGRRNDPPRQVDNRIENPRQDGSGYYPNNAGYGNNSNGYGLGVGNAGNVASDRGGNIPVDPRFRW